MLEKVGGTEEIEKILTLMEREAGVDHKVDGNE